MQLHKAAALKKDMKVKMNFNQNAVTMSLCAKLYCIYIMMLNRIQQTKQLLIQEMFLSVIF